MRASTVSDRMESLFRPPESASPLPSLMNSPSPRSRATAARAGSETVAARILASWPSGTSEWVR